MYLAENALSQVVEAVIGLMNDTQPFAQVTRGALPAGQGITCEVGPGSSGTLHMDKNMVIPMQIVVNGKHPNERILADALGKIHYALTRARSYPSGDGWQIVDIKNYSPPAKIGREDNNDWLMASTLLVEFYWRGE